MFRHFMLCVIFTGLLSGCVIDELTAPAPQVTAPVSEPVMFAPPEHSLHAWWSFFGDSTLDRLVSSALSLNPQDSRDKTLNLLSGVLHSYLEYRYIQNQEIWLMAYVQEDASRQKEEKLQAQLKIYTTTQARLRKKITEKTKLLPEFVDEILRQNVPLPEGDASPFLASPVALIDAMPGRFSKTTFNQLFGLSDNIFANPESYWHVKPGHALKNTKGGSAETRSKVSALEHDLIAYAHLREQTEILEKALAKQEKSDNATKDTLYKARLGALRAKYERVKALAKVYLALGVY